MNTETARAISERAWDGLYDRAGLPEFAHAERVATSVPEGDCRVVGYLHDLIEDGLMTMSELIECGLTVNQALALFLLTRTPERGTYTEYISMIVEVKGTIVGDIAVAVKLADIADNLTRPCPPEMMDMRRPGGRYDRARKLLERK